VGEVAAGRASGGGCRHKLPRRRNSRAMARREARAKAARRARKEPRQARGRSQRALWEAGHGGQRAPGGPRRAAASWVGAGRKKKVVLWFTLLDR
jgi:hypothetical protein